MTATKIEGANTQKFTFDFDGKELSYEIQAPTFDQITAALSQVKPNGTMDVIGAGKVIWELCTVDFDKEIEKSPKILISICIELANEYALPIDIDIKKK